MFVLLSRRDGMRGGAVGADEYASDGDKRSERLTGREDESPAHGTRVRQMPTSTGRAAHGSPRARRPSLPRACAS